MSTVLLAAALHAAGSQPGALGVEKISLWPGKAPVGQGKFEAAQAWLTLYRPAPGQANGAAMVICPGGGYGGLASGPEGHDIARWLVRHGLAGAVLEYRLPRGARLCRSWTPNGPSARCGPTPPSGTSTQSESASSASRRAGIRLHAGTHFDAGDPAAADPADRASCRPDFMVLIYPVITMGTATHAGSKQNLLGPAPKPELIERFSNEKQATAQTPPAFLAHARDDSVVSPQNSRDFVAALRPTAWRQNIWSCPTADTDWAATTVRCGTAGRPAALGWLVERKIMPTAAARPGENGR